MSTEIVKEDIVYSNNWAFLRVEPDEVLPKGTRVWKHTSYSQSYLDKYNIPPFNFRKRTYSRLDYAFSDGKTPVKELRSLWGTPNHVFYVADMALTEKYRFELYKTGEADYKAKDGNLYYPAPLDCTPDLAVSLSGKEVISGDNPWGSRLVSNTRQQSLGKMIGWTSYMRRDKEPEFAEDLIAEANNILSELYEENDLDEETIVFEKENDRDPLIFELFEIIEELEERIENLENKQ